jgi:hypothetical protein
MEPGELPAQHYTHAIAIVHVHVSKRQRLPGLSSVLAEQLNILTQYKVVVVLHAD